MLSIKEIRAKKWQEYYGKHRDEINARKKAYREKNAEHCRNLNRERYLKYADQHIQKARDYRVKFAEKARFTKYRSHAKSKGREFSLAFDEFVEIIKRPCIYCNQKGFGLDRVDSLLGYSLDNVVSCCSWCNRMKLDYSTQEFFMQIRRIFGHFRLTSLQESIG